MSKTYSFVKRLLQTSCEFMNKAYSFAKKNLSIIMKKPIDSSATFLLLMNKAYLFAKNNYISATKYSNFMYVHEYGLFICKRLLCVKE